MVALEIWYRIPRVFLSLPYHQRHSPNVRFFLRHSCLAIHGQETQTSSLVPQWMLYGMCVLWLHIPNI